MQALTTYTMRWDCLCFLSLCSLHWMQISNEDSVCYIQSTILVSQQNLQIRWKSLGLDKGGYLDWCLTLSSAIDHCWGIMFWSMSWVFFFGMEKYVERPSSWPYVQWWEVQNYHLFLVNFFFFFFFFKFHLPVPCTFCLGVVYVFFTLWLEI